MTTEYPELGVKNTVIWTSTQFRCVEIVLDIEHATPTYFVEHRSVDAMGEPIWEPWHCTGIGTALLDMNDEDRLMAQFIWELAKGWSNKSPAPSKTPDDNRASACADQK